MKFRKKHRQESEVYTDSLNDILFILLMLFLITATLANPNIVKVNQPRGEKDTKAKQNITVSIDKNQNFYIGQARVDPAMVDSALVREINKFKKLPTDTPTVVINADTVSYYGEVFRIMRLSKKSGAKVVATVK
ncbi:MAG TPA: biopolymer transporter ExbD [Chitinophagaceae bacterium]|nr:biopolymer transporter ExbD [Chitinophagaceae bacterium]